MSDLAGEAETRAFVADYLSSSRTNSYDGDAFWILFAGFLVFFMHAGFAMLEAGSVVDKNKVNILFKNIGTVTFGGIAYFLIGFGLAYGETDNSFIGGSKFAGSDFAQASDSEFGAGDSSNDRRDFFFQYAFCVTAATITSGAVAGRIKLEGYFILAVALTAFIYPVVTNWVWSSSGWASAFIGSEDPSDFLFGGFYEFACGVFDYAGSGVVHLTGGVSAFWAAKILGPRLERFNDDKSVTSMPGHNLAIATLGTMILWFGWYGFNCGSALAFDSANAAKVAITTSLAPASAAITGIIVQKVRTGIYDLPSTLNCVLAGLVSITAGCSTVSNWSAIPIGVIGAFIYIYSAELLLKLKIDDPIGAAPVHGFCGVWGLLAIGIFSTPEGVINAYSCPNPPPVGSGDWLEPLPGAQMLAQIVLALAIIAWVTVTVAPLCYLLKKLGMLRVDEEHELKGLDASEHFDAAIENDYDVEGNKSSTSPLIVSEPEVEVKPEESTPAPAVAGTEEAKPSV